MMHRASRQSGFSLVELLVTALIFGIGLLGLASLQVSTIRSNAGGRNRVTAAFLAEGCLSAIQAEGSLTWSYAAGVMGSSTTFAGPRTYTTAATNGTFGTFDVNGQQTPSGSPTQVFSVGWVRRATNATPSAPITSMNMNEFVVTVTWTDQVKAADGVTNLAASTMTISRLIRYGV